MNANHTFVQNSFICNHVRTHLGNGTYVFMYDVVVVVYSVCVFLSRERVLSGSLSLFLSIYLSISFALSLYR